MSDACVTFISLDDVYPPKAGMRRDYFTLEVRNADASTGGTPSVHIEFTGPNEQIIDRITGREGDPLDAGEVDVAYRLRDHLEDGDPSGVLGVTNRLTGEFILEMYADASDVLGFIKSARAAGNESGSDDGERYRIEISLDGDHVATYDKGTFLVYDDEGGLLREHSLIPNNVEL